MAKAKPPIIRPMPEPPRPKWTDPPPVLFDIVSYVHGGGLVRGAVARLVLTGRDGANLTAYLSEQGRQTVEIAFGRP